MRRPAPTGRLLPGLPALDPGILQPLRVLDGESKVSAMPRRRVGPDQAPRPFGRPANPSVPLCLRLRPSILEEVEADARDAGYPSAVAYIRALVETRTRPPVLNHRVYAELLRQLIKVGTNLNQLARAVNAGRAPYLPVSVLDDTQNLLARIYAFLLAPPQ